MPVSLALVETLAGAERARAVATALGMPSWGLAHRSERFGLSLAHVGTLSINTVLFWRHERIDIPVVDGVDDVALALAADAWSRTYRSRAEAVNALASPVHTCAAACCCGLHRLMRRRPRSCWTGTCSPPVCWTTACR